MSPQEEQAKEVAAAKAAAKAVKEADAAELAATAATAAADAAELAAKAAAIVKKEATEGEVVDVKGVNEAANAATAAAKKAATAATAATAAAKKAPQDAKAKEAEKKAKEAAQKAKKATAEARKARKAIYKVLDKQVRKSQKGLKEAEKKAKAKEKAKKAPSKTIRHWALNFHDWPVTTVTLSQKWASASTSNSNQFVDDLQGMPLEDGVSKINERYRTNAKNPLAFKIITAKQDGQSVHKLSTGRMDQEAGREMSKLLAKNVERPLEFRSGNTNSGVEFLKGAGKQCILDGKPCDLQTHDSTSKRNDALKIYSEISQIGSTMIVGAETTVCDKLAHYIQNIDKPKTLGSTSINNMAKALVDIAAEIPGGTDTLLSACKTKPELKKLETALKKEMRSALFGKSTINSKFIGRGLFSDGFDLKQYRQEFNDKRPANKRRLMLASRAINDPGPKILKELTTKIHSASDHNQKVKILQAFKTNYALNTKQSESLDAYIQKHNDHFGFDISSQSEGNQSKAQHDKGIALAEALDANNVKPHIIQSSSMAFLKAAAKQCILKDKRCDLRDDTNPSRKGVLKVYSDVSRIIINIDISEQITRETIVCTKLQSYIAGKDTKALGSTSINNMAKALVDIAKDTKGGTDALLDACKDNQNLAKLKTALQKEMRNTLFGTNSFSFLENSTLKPVSEGGDDQHPLLKELENKISEAKSVAEKFKILQAFKTDLNLNKEQCASLDKHISANTTLHLDLISEKGGQNLAIALAKNAGNLPHIIQSSSMAFLKAAGKQCILDGKPCNLKIDNKDPGLQEALNVYSDVSRIIINIDTSNTITRETIVCTKLKSYIAGKDTKALGSTSINNMAKALVDIAKDTEVDTNALLSACEKKPGLEKLKTALEKEVGNTSSHDVVNKQPAQTTAATAPVKSFVKQVLSLLGITNKSAADNSPLSSLENGNAHEETPSRSATPST